MTIKASTIIRTKFGDFKVCYHKNKNGECVSFSKGNLSKGIPVVRIHSACLFGEAFYSIHCDCGQHIAETMRLIQKHGKGVIVYGFEEGMGIGLENKIKTMEIQRTKKYDVVTAYTKLGFKKIDYRDYKAELNALRDLKLNKNIMVCSGSQSKIGALQNAGYTINKIIKPHSKLSKWAEKEKLTLKKSGYY